MKKNILPACVLAVATAAAAGAIGLPGGGGKVDTEKADELIAEIKEVSTNLEAAKVKTDECDSTLAAIAAEHGLTDVTGDPAKIAELKDALTEEEKAELQAQGDVMKTVPGDLSAVAAKATEVMGKIPDALTDLASQIAANPMAAKDLKDKQAQLQEGQAALEKITADVPALIDSATNLTSAITALM
jgi:chromosome segregation ATPase